MDLFNNSDASGGALSLSALNERVSEAIGALLPDACWIQAETSDVRVNASSGHCYLEFVEKDASGRQIVAKARGMIWARTFQLIRPYFEQETGQAFVSGLKVMVKVSVAFHKLYGYSLNVLDIEPAFTLGDLVRKRTEIIRRLKEEGIFDLNRELPFPALPQRIAVITSPTAAGYGDFESQLMNNPAGYPFYLKLFPAVMQGERAEASIIAALDSICRADCFDVVVLIRGGGSASDLNCFDSYLLAAHCAQFPLPVITGIGHERDESVTDLVAHIRMKTPTAVAAFLIERMDGQARLLNEMQQAIRALAAGILSARQTQLNLLTARFPSTVMRRIERGRTQLQALAGVLPASRLLIMQHRSALEEARLHLQNRWTSCLADRNRQLELTEQFLRMASPDHTLKRGYSLILKDGKAVRHTSDLSSGDEVTLRLADGERTAIIR